MTTPAVNTKVERVVEAFETLSLAAAIGIAASDAELKSAAHQDILDARKECADALREFLAPTIRLATVDGERA